MAPGKLCELTPNILSKAVRVIVVGDIHGDYESLRRACDLFDPRKDILIFLGDYADRGVRGVEVIDKVAGLIKKHPNRVIALKGNHEDYTEEGRPKFMPCDLIHEASEKRGSWRSYFRLHLEPFINRLYLAALIPGEVVFVHGGVSKRVKGLNALRFPSRKIEEDILWSDPSEGRGEHPNIRGAGVAFGEDVSEEVCRRLGVEWVVRSHQPRKAWDGPHVEHSGRVITTGSTTVYGGRAFVIALPARDFRSAFNNLMDYTIYLG